MANSTATHESFADISPRTLDAAVRSREDDPRQSSEFLAATNGALALKLAVLARGLPRAMTAEEAYMLGAADITRATIAHQESQVLAAALEIPSHEIA